MKTNLQCMLKNLHLNILTYNIHRDNNLASLSVKKLVLGFLSLSILTQLVTPSTMLLHQILEAVPGDAPDLQPQYQSTRLLIPSSGYFCYAVHAPQNFLNYLIHGIYKPCTSSNMLVLPLVNGQAFLLTTR